MAWCDIHQCPDILCDHVHRPEPKPRECCPMCRDVVRHLIDENSQIRCPRCGELSEVDQLITEDDDCGYDL